jgi:hypothetical protein
LLNIDNLPHIRQLAPIATEYKYYLRESGSIFMTIAMGFICTNATYTPIEIRRMIRKKLLLKKPSKMLFSVGKSFFALISLNI